MIVGTLLPHPMVQWAEIFKVNTEDQKSVNTAQRLPETPAEIAYLTKISVVTHEPLDRILLESAVRSQSAGACITFAGVVRNHDPAAAGEVGRLDYSAHPDATDYLQLIIAEANRLHAHPDDEIAHPVRIAAAHRIGSLAVGDEALILVASSAHRTEAFRACSEVVERIKAEVPIWKKQFISNGGAHWVGIE